MCPTAAGSAPRFRRHPSRPAGGHSRTPPTAFRTPPRTDVAGLPSSAPPRPATGARGVGEARAGAARPRPRPAPDHRRGRRDGSPDRFAERGTILGCGQQHRPPRAGGRRRRPFPVGSYPIRHMCSLTAAARLQFARQETDDDPRPPFSINTGPSGRYGGSRPTRRNDAIGRLRTGVGPSLILLSPSPRAGASHLDRHSIAATERDSNNTHR